MLILFTLNYSSYRFGYVINKRVATDKATVGLLRSRVIRQTLFLQ